MSYEQLIERLKSAKISLGHVMQIKRKGLFSKLSALDIKDEDLKKMTEDEAMDAQFGMVEVMAEMIHVIIRPGEDVTVEDITYAIPIDKIEELTEVLNVVFEKLGKMGKN